MPRAAVLFSPGIPVITMACLMAFHRSGDRAVPLLLRHVLGDHGDLDAHDRKVNEEALRKGFRILSAYTLTDGTKIFVETDGNRAVTTFYTVDEY